MLPIIIPCHRRRRRQRGYIEQLASSNYRGVAYAGVDLLTRWPRYSRKTVNTYDDPKKALVKLQNEIDEARDSEEMFGGGHR